MKHDESTNFKLVRAWAEGDYNNFNVKVGRFEFNPEGEFGLMWDTEVSGALVTVGNQLKFSALGGRLKNDIVGGGTLGESLTEEDASTIVGVRLDYDTGERGLFAGAGWYNIKDDDLAWSYNYMLKKNANRRHYNKANIWTVNLGYKFSDLLTLKGAYAQNTKADFENKSWHAELDYGNYDDASEKGQWSVYAGYRKYGTNVSFAPTEDDALRGTRGFVVGASWAPFKNIGVLVKYFNGKYNADSVNTGRGKASKIFGRVEFFF